MSQSAVQPGEGVQGDALPERAAKNKAESLSQDAIEGRISEMARTELSDLPHSLMHHIFGMLGPKELCVSSAVCRDWRELNRDSTSNRTWQEYYSKRWLAPRGTCDDQWQLMYGKKMNSARALSNKGFMDILYGHTGAVTSCSLLSSHGLLATGSVDNTVRLWDLKAGLPMSSSRQLKGPIRAVAIDSGMLVCGGGPDGFVRLWHACPSDACHLFDLTVPTRLAGHTGPVSSVTLDQRNIISASWDCTVRIWNRTTLQRESLLAFPDWIHSVKTRGSNLLVTAGDMLHVHSLETGQATYKLGHSPLRESTHWETGRTTAPLQVEGSHDGRTVFLAGADGAIVSVDLRAPKAGANVLWNQKAPVKSLSFEHPWLAAGTADGSVLLIDTEASNLSPKISGQALRRQRGRVIPEEFGKKQRASRQRLHASHESALCVDIQDNYVVCGSCDPIVKTWHFEHVERREKRAVTAPRRRRQRRAHFPPGTESDDEPGSDGDTGEGTQSSVLPVSRIPLSSSLPAALGGVGRFLHDKRPESHQRVRAADASRQGLQDAETSHHSSHTSSPSGPVSPTDGGASLVGRTLAARWDKPDVNDLSSSDGSEQSYELMLLARQARSRANEFKLSESPKRTPRNLRERLRAPVLPPSASCRSEAGRPSPENMANWRLCSAARTHRPS